MNNNMQHGDYIFKKAVGLGQDKNFIFSHVT